MSADINLILLQILILVPIIIFALRFFLKRDSEKTNIDLEKLVARVIEEKTESSSKNSLEKIGLTLNPFKEQLKELKDELKDIRSQQSASKENFDSSMRRMFEQTQLIQESAGQLTTALKGNQRKQGEWGEMLLEKSLAESGLRKDKDYFLQKGYKTADGTSVRPDAVVLLPGDRSIVIDSKVPLTAYMKYFEADNDADKEKYVKEHVRALKKHISDLSKKGYNTITELNSPDYILMFVPEAALSLAINNDWDLQALAMQTKMGFVTPINLIPILRMAESLWRQDRINENAEAIAIQAGKFIDKFNGLHDDFNKAKGYFKNANEFLDKAQGKLESAPGNLKGQIKKLEDLGAKAKKISS